jgi:hypothetical protein
MFDGRDYRQTFDEACIELALSSDPDEIRSRLIDIEWVLEEALRSAFFVQAALLSVIVLLPIWALFDVGSAEWPIKALCFAALLVFGTLTYWLSKFALWYEISRHLKSRRFGDPRLKGDTA